MSVNKKRGKLSKAEKKLQKEEDERKQREEEAARLLAEQEELRRQEEERREQEEQQRLKLKDRERREHELSEVRHLLEEIQNEVARGKQDLDAKAKWERYMRCDGSPDPSIAHEINTFISLWRDDPEARIGPVLENCALALRLIEELEDLLSDRLQPEVSRSDGQRHQETILSLQDLIHSKYNQATEEILKGSKANVDTETGNMQTVIQDADITLCLWVNFTKNPRFKGFQFHEAGLGFEVPKLLAVSDVAIRILHTRFDHLSHLSPGPHTTSQGSIGSKRSHPLTEQLWEGETEQGGKVEESTERKEEDRHSVRSETKKSLISTASEMEEMNSAYLKQSVKEEGKARRDSLQEETAVGGQSDSTHSEEPLMTVVGTDVIDLHQYMPLGGVFYFDALQIPPQSQLVNGWEMRELSAMGLQNFPYPADQSQLHNSTSRQPDAGTALASPPIGVTVTLPTSVVFLEDPQVARWDQTACQWTRNGICNITYDTSLKRVSFQMDSFYTFTFLQDMHVNMPFQAWELRPLGLNSAVLTITAAVTEVHIMIKEQQCKLTSVTGYKLPDVVGRWMSASALQKAMSSAGVNVFVKECSEKYVSINTKDWRTEQVAYEQMALLSSAVAFGCSRWNSHCGREYLVVKACEHLEAGPVLEKAWSLYLLSTQRSLRLQMEEENKSFSTALDGGTEFHATFLHMLRDSMGGTAHTRVQDSDPLFINCVLQLLTATRVLSYC